MRLTESIQIVLSMAQKIAKQLKRDLGIPVNRKRVKRLMRIMGIEAVYPKPNLSLNNTPHPIYPYLLKGLDIRRPNQVWGADITYIRMEKGFLYLVAFMDWFSRYVLIAKQILETIPNERRKVYTKIKT